MKVKKPFITYSAIWAAFIALFNALAFLIPAVTERYKFTDSFWIGYAFVILAFIGQLICSYFAFKADDINKLFCNVSLVNINYISLAVTYVIGAVCIILTAVPDWIAVVGCTGVLIFNIISVAFSVGEIPEAEKVTNTASSET